MAGGRGFTVLVHEWVTGGGLAGSSIPPTWAAEGRAMRRAIAADFAGMPGRSVHVIMTLDAQLPDEPGPWTVERFAASRNPNRLPGLAQTADCTVLVAPETMGTLAGLTRDLLRVGARLLGSSPEAIDLAGDKARLAEHLQSLRIETPMSRLVNPSAGLPADVRYPAVLKPVDGAGSIDTFYLAGARSLRARARGLSLALLQPFVAGMPMSASFLVGTNQRAWLIGMGAQRVSVSDGQFTYQGGTIPAPCRAAEHQLRPAIESVPGLRGFVGIDFLWDPERERATVLEINPRPTTSYVGLSRLLPRGHLARAWLNVCEPERADTALLDGLADLVHRQQPLTFSADGKLMDC
jgi:predicted ATP-grasp superfamily ATP-dependent carboligase